jgi:toxin ParE1/3/4
LRIIRVSNQAKDDLIAIWSYIASDNPRAADRMVDVITASYLQLTDSPGVGRDRHELRSGMYSLAVRSYVIFYRFTQSEVRVVRVLHGARNLRAVFRKEKDETYSTEDGE